MDSAAPALPHVASPGSSSALGSLHLHASLGATLRAVVRHSLPTVLEATVVPSLLFYVAWLTAGATWALVAALAWTYGALARRLWSDGRVSGLLILAVLGLTVRSVMALATGSTFVYFAQPIVGTTVVAVVFLVSARTMRPFVGRVAADFFPIPPEVAGRAPVQRLFRNLTVLWAGVHLAGAVTAGSLLLTLPTVAFVPTKTAACLCLNALGGLVSVVWSLRTARREGLVPAPPALAYAA